MEETSNILYLYNVHTIQEKGIILGSISSIHFGKVKRSRRPSYSRAQHSVTEHGRILEYLESNLRTTNSDWGFQFSNEPTLKFSTLSILHSYSKDVVLDLANLPHQRH